MPHRQAPDPGNDRLRRLRGWRNRSESDPSLGFLKKQFKSEVEKPYKQLADVTALWVKLVPGDLCGHTKLESLSRGVLRVVVDSSPRLYELDRLLRGGLEQSLITEHRGPAFRKVHVRLGAIDPRPG